MHVCIRIRVHGLPRYGISSVPPPRLGRADPSNMARLRQTLATGLQTAHSTGHTATAQYTGLLAHRGATGAQEKSLYV